MRVRTFWFITAFLLCHHAVWPQALTMQFPTTDAGSTASGGAKPDLAAEKVAAQETSAQETGVPDAPEASPYPIAEIVPAPVTGVPVKLEYKRMEKIGNIYTLTGGVRIEYKNYVLTADKISYDRDTSDAEAEGHVQLQGGRDSELINADHGKLNLDLETGRFENVTGSIGRQPSTSKRKLVYTTANPFIFTGRVLIKGGPERYQMLGGTMTSCLLPDPDWVIHSALIRVNYGQARASNSYFTLFKVPILYLPYVTHPVDSGTRQSGLLLPVVGTSSTKGTIVGDSLYLVFNRNAAGHRVETFATTDAAKILLQDDLRPCSTADFRRII
jgi:LPS-assembly protein